jgi:D-alanyl-lipoteichoic acid acyltransferase DltB (MBOAT superfamily)
MTDIYRGAVKPATTLREYAIFISFFPQLVAGPILRARDFLPQLREKIENASIGTKLRQITLVNFNFRFGVTMMAIGFFKKIFFADNVKILADQVFQNPIGSESFTIILGTIAFGIQIYCDFSGYSDIAIGAAFVLGFRLPMNFNKPYFATSPSDFWRRWHIALSSWLRDYLYVSLGGNRRSMPRSLANLMIVMVLGGLWHGASLNFIVWGVLHGSYLVVYKAGKQLLKNWNLTFFKTSFGVFVSILITQYLIFLTWIPFRVRDFDQMVYSMQKFVFLDFKTHETISLIMTNHKSTMIIIALFVIFSIISYKKTDLLQKISELKTHYWLAFLAIITLTVLFFSVGNTNDFIYFQF